MMLTDFKIIELAKKNGITVDDDAWDEIVELAFDIDKHLAQEYDNMISELEREIGMVRARVKRLEQENAWLEETNVRLMQSNITKI